MTLGEAITKFTRPKTLKKDNTWEEYLKRLNAFISIHGQDASPELVLEDKYIRDYVLDPKSADERYRYYALIAFHKFIQESILKIPIEKRRVFPIAKEEIDERKKHVSSSYRGSKGNGITFLSSDISLSEFLNEKYYEHLKDLNAILIAKAIMALMLSAGYSSGKIFPNNNNKSDRMRLDEFEDLGDFGIKVKNLYADKVEWLCIQGISADYIRDYYKLRISHKNVSKEDEPFFFVKLWDKFLYDRSVLEKYNDPDTKIKTPYNVYTLINYMIKYICDKLDLSFTLYPSDLAPNAILHSLYCTKGASLEDIIQIFGYKDVAKHAIEKYLEEIDNSTKDGYFGLNPFKNDFFPQPSPVNPLIDEGEDKLLFELKNQLSRFRNTTKMRRLKFEYKHTCQICHKPIFLMNDIGYSEVHHIQPHGRPHYGPDEYKNMVVLCPNHHALFDLGVIAIDPEDQSTIIHVDQTDPLNGQKIYKLPTHTLSPTCLRYHYKYKFEELVNRLKSITKPNFKRNC